MEIIIEIKSQTNCNNVLVPSAMIIFGQTWGKALTKP